MIKHNSEAHGVIGVLYACQSLSNLIVARHANEQMNVIIKLYNIWSDLLRDHCHADRTFAFRVCYCTSTVSGKYFYKLNTNGFSILIY